MQNTDLSPPPLTLSALNLKSNAKPTFWALVYDLHCAWYQPWNWKWQVLSVSHAVNRDGAVPVSMCLGTWSGISVAGGESLQLLKMIQSHNSMSPLESRRSLIVCWNSGLPRLNVGFLPESEDFCIKAVSPKPGLYPIELCLCFALGFSRQWLCDSPVLHQVSMQGCFLWNCGS